MLRQIEPFAGTPFRVARPRMVRRWIRSDNGRPCCDVLVPCFVHHGKRCAATHSSHKWAATANLVASEGIEGTASDTCAYNKGKKSHITTPPRHLCAIYAIANAFPAITLRKPYLKKLAFIVNIRYAAIHKAFALVKGSAPASPTLIGIRDLPRSVAVPATDHRAE